MNGFVGRIKANKRNILLCTLFFVCIFMAYNVFMKEIMTGDYMPGYINRGKPGTIGLTGVLVYGRFITIITHYVYKCLWYLGVSHYSNAFVLQIIGMLFYAISAAVIYLVFERLVLTDRYVVRIFLFLSVLISFVNPFMIETYMYGALDWGLGILLSVTGFSLWTKKKYLPSVIFCFLGITAYETNTFIIFILISFFIYFEQIHNVQTLRKFAKRYILGGIFCVSIAAFDLFIQRLGIRIVNAINSSSDNTKQLTAIKQIDTSSGIDKFFDMAVLDMKVVFTSYGMLPMGFTVISGLIIFAFVIYVWRKTKRIDILMIFIIEVPVCIAAAFSLGLLGMYYAQRMLLSLFFLMSMLCLTPLVLYFHLYGENDGGRNYLRTYGAAIAGIFLVIYCCTETCITDAYIAQAVDRYEAKMIEREIEKYEKKSGKTITTIASCGGYESDIGGTNFSSEYLNHYRHTIPYTRITFYDWSQGQYINYVNDKNYEARLMTDDEIDRYFGWDETVGYFDPEEQLIFEDSTLFWRIY